MNFAKYLKLTAKSVFVKCPFVATMYRSIRDELDIKNVPIVTPYNFKLAGNKAMAKGVFEPKETEIVRDILKNVDILVNVGANIGYYCCHALSMDKSVIAFEPIQRNLRYLYKNIVSNGWSNIEIYPIALSNKTGILKIYGGGTGASIVQGWAGIPEDYVTLVPVSTSDIVLGKRLEGKKALVIVDVEGAEKWMLEGAKMMLANEPKPIWFVEITTGAHQPHGIQMNPYFKETFELFYKNGYQAFCADQNLQQITRYDVESVLSGTFELKSHNFMFCE